MLTLSRQPLFRQRLWWKPRQLLKPRLPRKRLPNRAAAVLRGKRLKQRLTLKRPLRTQRLRKKNPSPAHAAAQPRAGKLRRPRTRLQQRHRRMKQRNPLRKNLHRAAVGQLPKVLLQPAKAYRLKLRTQVLTRHLRRKTHRTRPSCSRLSLMTRSPPPSAARAGGAAKAGLRIGGMVFGPAP